MEKPEILPAWNEDVLTAEQNSRILARSRSTLAGYISSFPQLMVEPVVAGSTRKFSIGKLTGLCLVRQLIGAGLPQEFVRENLNYLVQYSADLFNSLPPHCAFGYDSEVRRNDKLLRIERRYVYDFTPKSFAVFLPGFGTDEPQSAVITEHVTTSMGLVLDLESFAPTVSVLPIDQNLKICWSRALTVLHGHPLYD